MELTAEKCLRQAPAAPELEQRRLTHREIIELRAGRSKPHRQNSRASGSHFEKARLNLNDSEK
jgi:hypothetical protein